MTATRSVHASKIHGRYDDGGAVAGAGGAWPRHCTGRGGDGGRSDRDRGIAMKRLMLVCGILLSGGACGEPLTRPATVQNPLLPLTVGTQWSYFAVDTLIGTVPLSGPLAPDSSFTVHVVGDSVDGGGTHWAEVDSLWRLLDKDMPQGHGLYTNASDGFYELLSGVLPSFLIVYPASVGEKSLFGPAMVTADTVVTVPAGTFHCIRYDKTEGTLTWIQNRYSLSHPESGS